MTIDLEKAKHRLAKRREEIEAHSRMSAEVRAPVELDQVAVGRLSRMDAMQQQAMAEAAERARKRDLVRIEMAERRIASGDYGYCEECGEEIPDGRLAIDPMASHCVGCAK
ncbi:TraR/DksA family transcriptional regulator [Oricola thermophila]|uniref:TraR/DksA C4-type zinc finger protein n=1 Tax=Oricola thermophila TaxID=2742145 RepID=A0A6N1VHZ1_9HYPH|nr:TraR/DksA C4-type zinc finger protein [Oricola thermophila]QKV18942.1 TraR/DksA C4-type zinc finger protein [Oricola thermophila]